MANTRRRWLRGFASAFLAALAVALVACSGGSDKLDLKGVTQHGATLGNSDATLSIKLYENLTCETCKKFEEDVLPKLVKDYVRTGRVQLTFQHVPLGPTAASDDAHLAAACAGDQDKLWDYNKILFDIQTKTESAYKNDQLKKYADSAGLDRSKFDPCIDGNPHQPDLDVDMAAFQGLAPKGVRLPVMEFSDEIVAGATDYADVKLAIDDELQSQQ